MQPLSVAQIRAFTRLLRESAQNDLDNQLVVLPVVEVVIIVNVFYLMPGIFLYIAIS